MPPRCPPLNFSLPAGGPLPGDMAQGHVKSPILPSGNVALAPFLSSVGAERDGSVLGGGAQVPPNPAAPPPALQGLSTSLLGSVISGLQKPKQGDNGPPTSGVGFFGGVFRDLLGSLGPPPRPHPAFFPGLAAGGAPQRLQDPPQPLPEPAEPPPAQQPRRFGAGGGIPKPFPPQLLGSWGLRISPPRGFFSPPRCCQQSFRPQSRGPGQRPHRPSPPLLPRRPPAPLPGAGGRGLRL